MFNPITLVQDINLAVSTIEKLKKALPALQKLVADIKQAADDKKDATKLYADIEVVMSDVQLDLAFLSSLFPNAPTA